MDLGKSMSRATRWVTAAKAIKVAAVLQVRLVGVFCMVGAVFCRSDRRLGSDFFKNDLIYFVAVPPLGIETLFFSLPSVYSTSMPSGVTDLRR